MADELKKGAADSGPSGTHCTHIVEDGAQDPLTCIPDAYTLSATQELDANETEKLMVKHFLETTAEVALSVASRKGGQ